MVGRKYKIKFYLSVKFNSSDQILNFIVKVLILKKWNEYYN